MIQIAFSSTFKRSFKGKVRVQKDLEEKFWHRVEIFKENPFDGRLRTHKLSGRLKDLWSFSVEYDVRVIFYFVDDGKVVFVDIGVHDEVY